MMPIRRFDAVQDAIATNTKQIAAPPPTAPQTFASPPRKPIPAGSWSIVGDNSSISTVSKETFICRGSLRYLREFENESKERKHYIGIRSDDGNRNTAEVNEEFFQAVWPNDMVWRKTRVQITYSTTSVTNADGEPKKIIKSMRLLDGAEEKAEECMQAYKDK